MHRLLPLYAVAGACSSAASAPASSAAATHDAGARASATAPATRVIGDARHALDDPRRRIGEAPRSIGDARADGVVVRARVVASVDGAPASDRPVYARLGQHVELFALVEVERGGTRAWFGDAPSPKLAGTSLRVLPLARAPALAIAWQRVEPAAASYSNEAGGSFHFEPIDYRATPIAGGDGGSLDADVRPTLTDDHGADAVGSSAVAAPSGNRGVGTMRFRIIVTRGDRDVASPGPEARRGRGSGGLVDDVLRVSIRRDDTYLGYLTEMYGQPYVWASAGLSDATHQSERLEGADCADFVVYGARRAGKKLAYTWTGGLPQITTLLAAGTRGEDGIYRDRRGEPLAFTRAGDLVLFPRHVGVLVEDRGTIGVLDDADVIVHALFDTPKQVPIADSGYADKPVELRRFR